MSDFMILSRTLFLVGSIGFVTIGVLHTFVHLTELSTEALKLRFDAFGAIEVQGASTSSWDLFQGTSLLMGFFSLCFGLVLLAHWSSLSKQTGPNPLICLSALLMLLFIVGIGFVYLTSFQVYGGLFGILCFGLPLIFRQKEN